MIRQRCVGASTKRAERMQRDLSHSVLPQGTSGYPVTRGRVRPPVKFADNLYNGA